jgi:flavin-binding protein dodecin
MSNHTYKKIELVGSFSVGIEDAFRTPFPSLEEPSEPSV